MRTQPSATNALGISAASAMLLICGEVSAQTIIPLDQQRSVNTFLIVPQCLGKTFDEDSAEGFGPFDGVVESVLGCDSGFGSGFASQQSQIGASSMSGSGSGTSEAGGPVPNVIHAFGYSYFEVTFELPSASNFTLDGLISAASSKDQFPFAGASISLRDSDLQIIFDHLVEPGPGGKANSQIIEEVGMLVPGVYTLQAQAGSFIDNDVPPSLSGEASFDFTFEVTVTTTPDSVDAFRGFYDSGTLEDVLESDDDDLCYEPGIVLNPSEAPITLDFFGTLPNDSPALLDVTIESSANTVGLELTFSFWNFNTASWDIVGTDTQSLNADTVRTFAGIPADHVESGTGAVITRYEVRVVSLIFLFPWLDCVDHVFWTTTN